MDERWRFSAREISDSVNTDLRVLVDLLVVEEMSDESWMMDDG